MVIILLLLLVLASFALIKSADFVVISLKRISKKLRARTFVVSAIVLALGTSFPEISIGITSALSGTPELTLGVVVGSNIANISLVAGLAGLYAGKIHIRGDYLKRDVWIALVSGLAPLLLVADGSLTRPDGVVLLAMYAAYATSFFRSRFVQVGRHQEADAVIRAFIRQFNIIEKGAKRDVIRLVFGVVLLIVSADVVVRIAQQLALIIEVPVFVIGVVVLAIGTSLPELVFSFRSLKDHQTGMFFGNILGSTIANSTLIIGLTALIHPIGPDGSGLSYVTAAWTFFLVSVVFLFFAETKRRVDWWEALLLVAVYVGFVTVEFCGCFY